MSNRPDSSKVFKINEINPESFQSFKVKKSRRPDTFGHELPATLCHRLVKIEQQPPLLQAIKSQNTLSKEIRKRNVVPHDFPIQKYSHPTYCQLAPHQMITKSISHSCRNRNTTFGKSNRILFLNQLEKILGPQSVTPPYPPNDHGVGGQGSKSAIGLTLAGSASDELILGPVCTFGRTDGKKLFHRPRGMNELFNGPDECMRAKTFHRETKEMKITKDATDPCKIQDILSLGHFASNPNPNPRPNPLRIAYDKEAPPLRPHSRYESNPSFKRDTSHTIQAPQHSHFSISESKRFSREPFIDDIKERHKVRYQIKLKEKIRDKNMNSMHGILAI